MRRSVPRSVPNQVPFSTSNSVEILTEPQLKPRTAPDGNGINPVVPKTDPGGEPANQPHFRAYGGTASVSNAENGAPSVPRDGFMWQPGVIDPHYRSEFQPKGNPYATVGRPGTLGWLTRTQEFINGIFTSQDKDNAGWQVRHPQQRTSVMLNVMPPHGLNGAFWAPPEPQPQATRYNRIVPTVGTDAYGSGVPSSLGGYQPGRVLNKDTFGAGQSQYATGGNTYTPSPGPPPTNSTAGESGSSSGMPTWG